MVGEKIDLSGLNINGEEVSAAEFENKIVMVVFWSVYKKQSSQFLLKMSIAGRRWEERGIRILAVNKDQEVDASLIHDAMKPISNVTFVFGDAKNNYANNIFEQCPSDKTPRVMLVQRDGHVVDINVPLGEAVTQVDLLSR